MDGLAGPNLREDRRRVDATAHSRLWHGSLVSDGRVLQRRDRAVDVSVRPRPRRCWCGAACLRGRLLHLRRAHQQQLHPQRVHRGPQLPDVQESGWSRERVRWRRIVLWHHADRGWVRAARGQRERQDAAQQERQAVVAHHERGHRRLPRLEIPQVRAGPRESPTPVSSSSCG